MSVFSLPGYECWCMCISCCVHVCTSGGNSWLPKGLDCPCVIISADLQLMFHWLQGILIISRLAIGLTIFSGCWHCWCLSQPIRSSSLTSAIIFRQKVLGTLPTNPHFGCWPNKALYDTTVIASFVWYWSAIRQNTIQHFTKAQVMQYYLLLALQLQVEFPPGEWTPYVSLSPHF